MYYKPMNCVLLDHEKWQLYKICWLLERISNENEIWSLNGRSMFWSHPLFRKTSVVCNVKINDCIFVKSWNSFFFWICWHFFYREIKLTSLFSSSSSKGNNSSPGSKRFVKGRVWIFKWKYLIFVNVYLQIGTFLMYVIVFN